MARLLRRALDGAKHVSRVTRRGSLAPQPCGGSSLREHVQATGGMMNKNQKRTLVAVIALIVAMFLYPPFQSVLPNRVVHNMGYRWIFDPPAGLNGFVTAMVDVQMLLVQLLGILIVGGLVFFLAKNQSPTR